MGKGTSRDLFPGTLELMVLRIVALEPLHGYAIATRIAQRSQDLLKVEEGSLYPALQRLLRSGFVDAAPQLSATGRQVRTYSITTKGKRHLEQEGARFDAMVLGIQRVLSTGSAS